MDWGSNGVSLFEGCRPNPSNIFPLKRTTLARWVLILWYCRFRSIKINFGLEHLIQAYGQWTYLIQVSTRSSTSQKKKGLPPTTIYSTIPDNAGNLWMSTNEGIIKYEIDKNIFTNFGPGDGLQQEEFNRLAFDSL